MTGRATALHGHLHLVAAADAAGRTFLARQSFAAPMHLSKPHWDGHHLIVNAVNPTAGLFSGDTVALDLRVETDARLLLTSPSATRIHRARADEPDARATQRFHVAAGGHLDVLPELLIAQAGARFAQETHLTVAAGGTLLFFELLAPGRVASGEVFAFERLRSEVRLEVDGHLLALERSRLAPDGPSLRPLRVHHPHSYHATWLAVFPRAAAVSAAIARLGTETTLTGASALGDHACVGKILAADSPSLRRALTAVRDVLHSALALPAPRLRKL